MNDALIRENFHRKRLRRQHSSADTRVVDELGLHHGEHRADIAVINGHLIGFEIKSNEDTLDRLARQIPAYCAIFDRIAVVVGGRHLGEIEKHVPETWGIIAASEGVRGSIQFKTLRPARKNLAVKSLSVARLLWRPEIVDILARCGISGKHLRQPREYLYELMVETIAETELRALVRGCLKSRKTWRDPQ